MRRIVVLLFLLGLLAGGAVARPHKPCPAKGSSTDKDVQKLDRGKNRKSVPEHFKKTVTLEFILGPGKDSTRFSNHYAARVEGYIISAERMGGETCNCESTFPDDFDFHLYIAADSNETVKKRCMVVEITPWSRSIHPDWTIEYIKSLRKKPVRIGGWMLYDWIHQRNSVKYGKGGNGIWRNTCWEIHPVTSIDPE